MRKEEAITLIIEYYNETKEDKLFNNTAYGKGHLCAILYILTNVYGIHTFDDRLK